MQTEEEKERAFWQEQLTRAVEVARSVGDRSSESLYNRPRRAYDPLIASMRAAEALHYKRESKKESSS